MLKLQVENAYGLKGKHEFVFKPGLNFLFSSNAEGASSAVRSLALLVGQPFLTGAIHRAADSANVKLHVDGGGEYHVRLKWASNLPAVTEAQLLDPRALNAVIVNEKHPLHRHLDSETVREFIGAAANLSRLREERDEQEAACAAKQAQYAKLDATIKSLEKMEPEYRKVKARIQTLDEEYAALCKLAKKEEAPEASQLQALKHIESKVMKYRKSINEFQKTIREKTQSLAETEASLAVLETRMDSARTEEKMEEVKLEKDKLDREKESRSRLVTFAAALQALGYQEKCPACAIFRIHSDWSKILVDVYAPTLKNYQEARVAERDSCKKKIDDCVRKLRDLHNQSRGLEGDIALRKSERGEYRSVLNELNESLKDAQRRYITANTEWQNLLKRLGKEVAVYGKMHDAEDELKLLQEQYRSFKAPMEELRNARAAQASVKSEVKIAEEQLKEKESKLTEALQNARSFFNNTAKTLLLELGLKGFREVTVDENFDLRLVREGYVQQATELSSSEAATLTILLALAAKRAYFPTFPFFAIDTIATSYNLTAHRRLMDFLARELHEHVIVTVLAPKEHELKVVHTLPPLLAKA
jgi:hypothetical protein